MKGTKEIVTYIVANRSKLIYFRIADPGEFYPDLEPTLEKNTGPTLEKKPDPNLT